MSDAVKEMRRLIDQLNEASRTYYQEAREIMSCLLYTSPSPRDCS